MLPVDGYFADFKTSGCSDNDSTLMRSLVFTFWHESFNQITGLKTMYSFGLLCLAAWEAVLVQINHPPTAASDSPNEQWPMLRAKFNC